MSILYPFAGRAREANMNDHGNPVSRSWRRSLQFSVRGLIAVVLSSAFGSVGSCTASHSHEAVAVITRTGGFVRYDWESRY